MPTENVTPIRPPDTHRQLSELLDGLNGAKCTLHCAVQTLDMSSAVDGCEDAARARNVAHRVLQSLDTIEDNLDRFTVSIAHHGAAPDPDVGAAREAQS